jgi:hypothetical protein
MNSAWDIREGFVILKQSKTVIYFAVIDEDTQYFCKK